MKEKLDIALYDPFDSEYVYIQEHGETEGKEKILNDCKKTIELFFNDELELSIVELGIMRKMFHYYKENANLKGLDLKYLFCLL